MAVTAVHLTAFGRRIPAVNAGALWRALVGIDLSATPGESRITVEALTSSGSLLVVLETLPITAKVFPTRRLRVDPRFVNPPAAVRARILDEAARLGRLFATVTPAPLWRGPFTLPIPGAVVSGFGVRSEFNGAARAPHGGADLAGTTGTPIRAPNAGRVVLVSDLYFTGNTVVVDHGLGLLSLFAHMSRVDVREGEVIASGTTIGAVGATGRVTGPHLHWTVRLQEARVDPLSLIYALSDATTGPLAVPAMAPPGQDPR
jgi:murein DD-endopeptidase MepM/ murein hydrolase activator NlpD